MWLLFAALQISLPSVAMVADARWQVAERDSAFGITHVEAQDARYDPPSHPAHCAICHFLTVHGVKNGADQLLDLHLGVPAAAVGKAAEISLSPQATSPFPRGPPIS